MTAARTAGGRRGTAACDDCILGAAAALVVVAAAVGWFLPLLGLSLLGFLLVDTAIGVAKARRASRNLSAPGHTLPGNRSEQKG
jgi:hypothetical protein